MRVFIGGMIASALAAGAVWFAVAGATLAGYAGGPYQIYIFDSREGHSIYAVAVGERAAAARAEGWCPGCLRTILAGLSPTFVRGPTKTKKYPMLFGYRAKAQA